MEFVNPQFYEKNANKLKSLATLEFRFVSWLNANELVGIGKQNLYRIRVQPIKIQQLNKWPFPNWYQGSTGSARSHNQEVKLKSGLRNQESVVIKIENNAEIPATNTPGFEIILVIIALFFIIINKKYR